MAACGRSAGTNREFSMIGANIAKPLLPPNSVKYFIIISQQLFSYLKIRKLRLLSWKTWRRGQRRLGLGHGQLLCHTTSPSGWEFHLWGENGLENWRSTYSGWRQEQWGYHLDGASDMAGDKGGAKPVWWIFASWDDAISIIQDQKELQYKLLHREGAVLPDHRMTFVINQALQPQSRAGQCSLWLSKSSNCHS